MKRKNRITRIFAILTLVALLVMMLPVSVMAKGNGKPEKPAQATEKTEREPKADKAAKAPKVKSNPQAAFVAARNEWAKELGMPPGYANIMYKYLVLTEGAPAVTREAGSNEPAMLALKEFFAGLTPESNPGYFNEGQLDIKVLMSTIKQEKLLAEETKLELSEVEELDDDDEEEDEDDLD